MLTLLYGRELLKAAASIQTDADILGLRRKPTKAEKTRFRQVIADADIRAASERLYEDGHFNSAVLEAFKAVNNFIKDKSRLTSLDGAALMRQAFSMNNPRLALSDLKTASKRDQQQGYMDIYAGCMTGIRNPSAHELKYLADPEVALKLIGWADHLILMAKNARRKRPKASKATP